MGLLISRIQLLPRSAKEIDSSTASIQCHDGAQLSRWWTLFCIPNDCLQEFFGQWSKCSANYSWNGRWSLGRVKAKLQHFLPYEQLCSRRLEIQYFRPHFWNFLRTGLLTIPYSDNICNVVNLSVHCQSSHGFEESLLNWWLFTTQNDFCLTRPHHLLAVATLKCRTASRRRGESKWRWTSIGQCTNPTPN